MWRSACVSAKKSLSSALRPNSPSLGLLRPLSEANAVSAANSFSRDDQVYHHHDKSQKNLDVPFEKLVPFHGLGKESTANWGKTLGYQLISRGYLTEANRNGKFQNEMSGDEEQRITSAEVGQLNDLSEAQLYKKGKRFGEGMKIAVPVGIAPFAVGSIEGANQLSAMGISVQSYSALLVNLAVMWHIKDGMKEILADYVHQQVTREWISVLLRLFLLIVAKDLFFLL